METDFLPLQPSKECKPGEQYVVSAFPVVTEGPGQPGPVSSALLRV